MTKHPLFWLPNFLTVLRCVMACFIAWIIIVIARQEMALSGMLYDPSMPPSAQSAHLLASEKHRHFWGTIGFIVFSLTALTDWVDGYLARKWKVESQFGRLLDPIADKLTVGLPLIAIAAASEWVLPVLLPVIIIIFRDLLITILRFSGLSASAMQVRFIAKFKTFLEMLVVAAFFLALALLDTQSALKAPMLSIWLILLWLVAALSAYTGIVYLIGLFSKPSAEISPSKPTQTET